jgi:hypothetical protein
VIAGRITRSVSIDTSFFQMNISSRTWQPAGGTTEFDRCDHVGQNLRNSWNSFSDHTSIAYNLYCSTLRKLTNVQGTVIARRASFFEKLRAASYR